MTGHAWPLTQGDSKTRCRKSKVHERHDTHSIRQSRPVRKRAANQRLVPKVTGGQLRLSLTNTYHEWPVINALPDSLLLHEFDAVFRAVLGWGSHGLPLPHSRPGVQ